MHDDIRVPAAPAADPPKETTFETPDQVAAHDEAPDMTIDMADEEEKEEPLAFSPQQTKTKRKFWPPTKKQWLIAAAVVVVLGIGGAVAALALRHKPITNYAATKPPAKAQTSNLVPSTLSGLPVNPSVNKSPITAVMIENTPDARPQAGLSQAGVVFEALTEGGITRFMALFQDQLPTNVGPVRSARPYFIDWALGFDAPYVHDGGSPQGLSDIQSLGVKNIDYLDYPAYFTRVSSRPAPHNLYTSIPGLIKLEASNGWTSSNYSGWPRKTDAPASSPSVTSINFNLSYSTYAVNYAYDAQTNSYNRSEGGAAQTDANSGKQLSPKVVIGMVVPWSQGSLDTSDAYYSVYSDIGSGEALVFQDGGLTIGQWNKASAGAPLTFTTSSGAPLKLDAGQTWITALASASEASYK